MSAETDVAACVLCIQLHVYVKVPLAWLQKVPLVVKATPG